ncbi:UNVERIFIED_CONTAM: hypothetical protein Sradi_6448700 [Sesamum radiatum]|uniref:Uncharacterized protein n=1 Tax=Sesamum radiatum TaxID=300843 RepID=A0AAW2K578_SESRA
MRFGGGGVPSDDPSEATFKRSEPDPSPYTGGQRWSFRQATRRLLDESSEEDEKDEEEEGSSPGEGVPMDEANTSNDAKGTYPSRMVGFLAVFIQLGSIIWWRSLPFLLTLFFLFSIQIVTQIPLHLIV